MRSSEGISSEERKGEISYEQQEQQPAEYSSGKSNRQPQQDQMTKKMARTNCEICTPNRITADHVQNVEYIVSVYV